MIPMLSLVLILKNYNNYCMNIKSKNVKAVGFHHSISLSSTLECPADDSRLASLQYSNTPTLHHSKKIDKL